MRAGVTSLVLAGALALGAASATARSTRVIELKTPSGNIGCIYTNQPDVLRCDIRSGLNPRPRQPSNCDLDYGDAVQMGRTGRAALVCHGDTALDPRAQVLAYGRFLTFAGFKCTSRTTGLTCSNASGHGWFLSRESYRIF